VQFVWHGVNDEANLWQFLASGVGWAECDIRRDPLDRLVLRHDSFEETPWHRAEHPFRLEACLQALGEQDRSVALDLKEGGEVIDRVLGVVAAMGIDDGRLWFNAQIEVLCEPGIRRLAEAHPGATISVPVDFLGPLLLAAPAGRRGPGGAAVLGGEPLVAGLADAWDQGADGSPGGAGMGGQRLRRPRPGGVPGGVAAPPKVGDGRFQLP
jgi:hypothetical protein